MIKTKKKQGRRDLATRLWQKDATVWSDQTEVQDSISNRLGWLDSVDWMLHQVDELVGWVEQVTEAGKFDRVVVLGMGGSSLAPEVFSTIFEQGDGHPDLLVLDSTSPLAVEQIRSGDLTRSLFIVASKSGTTLETTDLYRFFFDQIAQVSDVPGQQFVAITDGGSWLENHAAENGFLKTFVNPADIGGRYSALSYFGLVPAALYGVNVKTLLERAKVMVKQTTQDDEEENPGLRLGLAMSENAAAGRDKMLLVLPESMVSFGAWVEQLVAESTGKQGVGILPVITPYVEDKPEFLFEGSDTFNVVLLNAPDEAMEQETDLQFSIDSPIDLGAEFFRWEFATAVAAAELGINPFDEPNVSEAKRSTNRFIDRGLTLPLSETARYDEFTVHAADLSAVAAGNVVFGHKLLANGYVAILAYLPMTRELVEHLEHLRFQIANYYDVVCTAGFGPRYLHSTGQLHKGGPRTGAFIQIVETPDLDHAVPGREYGFARLIAAQADGDFSVLSEKELSVMRFNLKGDRLQAIDSLTSVFADMV